MLSGLSRHHPNFIAALSNTMELIFILNVCLPQIAFWMYIRDNKCGNLIQFISQFTRFVLRLPHKFISPSLRYTFSIWGKRARPSNNMSYINPQSFYPGILNKIGLKYGILRKMLSILCNCQRYLIYAIL